MEPRRKEAIEFAGTDLERVELSMPASPELWSLARMTAAAVAALVDFGYDEIADLRLAIDELCTLCVSGDLDHTTLLLGYSWAGDEIRITCAAMPDAETGGPVALAAVPDETSAGAPGTVPAAGAEPAASAGTSVDDLDVDMDVDGGSGAFDMDVAPAMTRDELSARILDALVDEHGVRTEGATRRGWIRKRRSTSPFAAS